MSDGGRFNAWVNPLAFLEVDEPWASTDKRRPRLKPFCRFSAHPEHPLIQRASSNDTSESAPNQSGCLLRPRSRASSKNLCGRCATQRLRNVVGNSLFRELMSGVEAMREHREGRLTLKTHRVEPITVPSVDPDFVRETREALHMSRQVFAFRIGVNPRTLERWEQGRSRPNEQASALIRLVWKFPDTLERLESLSVPA
jgi:putative transcriptional regulator